MTRHNQHLHSRLGSVMCREHRDPLRYTCKETCEMDVGAVCAVSRNLTKIVSITTNGSQRIPCRVYYRAAVVWCGHDKRKRGASALPSERTVVRDTLTEEHRPRTNHWKCCMNMLNRGSGANLYWLIVFPVQPTSDATADSAKNACNHPGKRI